MSQISLFFSTQFSLWRKQKCLNQVSLLSKKTPLQWKILCFFSLFTVKVFFCILIQSKDSSRGVILMEVLDRVWRGIASARYLLCTIFLCLSPLHFGYMFYLKTKLWEHGAFPTIARICLTQSEPVKPFAGFVTLIIKIFLLICTLVHLQWFLWHSTQMTMLASLQHW